MDTKLKLYFGLLHLYSVKILKNRAFRLLARGEVFYPILLGKIPVFNSIVNFFTSFFTVSPYASSNNDIGESLPSYSG